MEVQIISAQGTRSVELSTNTPLALKPGESLSLPKSALILDEADSQMVITDGAGNTYIVENAPPVAIDDGEASDRDPDYDPDAWIKQSAEEAETANDTFETIPLGEAASRGFSSGTSGGTNLFASNNILIGGGLLIGTAGVALAASGGGGSGSSGVPDDVTAPVRPRFALAEDSGPSASDNVSKNGLVSISNLEAKATWEYSTDGGSSFLTGTGNSFTLAEGIYSAGNIVVRQTDLAGNVSAPGSNASTFTIDVSNPAAPSLSINGDTGASNSDGITNDATVNVSGIEANASWEFSTDNGNTFEPGSGSSFELADGSYPAGTIQVRQTDLAGNSGNIGILATAVTIDTAAPAAPTLALAVDSGGSSSDDVSNQGTINVSGLEANASWEFSIDNGASFNVGSGSSFFLAEGSYAAGSIQVRQTDVAGNLGNTGSNAGPVIVDVSSPAAPTLALATDSGSDSSDGISNDGTVNVSGLEANASWEFSTDNGNTFSSGSGNSFVVAEGSYAAGTIQVRQTDLAGNPGSAGSLAASITVDTSKPDAPTLALATDSGSDNSDGISNDGTVNVSGLEANASWEFSTDNGNTFSSGSGNSFVVAEGSYAPGAVQVRQTDVAGNRGNSGALADAIRVDTTAPAPPTVTLANDTGDSASDGISKVGTVNVGGLEPAASWQYSTDGGNTFSAGSGSSFALGEGTYLPGDIVVQQTDVAGNQGPTGSNALLIIIDMTAPTLLSSIPADEATGVSPSADIELTFSEDVVAAIGNIVISNGTDIRTIDVGDSLQVTFNADTATVNPLLPLAPLSPSYSVMIDSSAVTDVAGNSYAGIADDTTLNFGTGLI